MTALRSLFGPNKDEVWQQLCREIGAEFVSGGFWKGNKVVAKVKNWTVTLDTYTVSDGKTSRIFTRLRAPFVNPGGFRFTIYRKGVFSALGKWLGMQDIETGYDEFDEAFIIKGTDESKVRSLFADAAVRRLIEEQPTLHLEVKDSEGFFGTKFPEDVDELCFMVGGVITEKDRLKSLFELFSVVLDDLCRIGGAYPNDPNVTLS